MFHTCGETVFGLIGKVVPSTSPLKSVAGQCGFSSVQHMAAFFHKRLGHTPAEIRKNYHPESRH